MKVYHKRIPDGILKGFTEYRIVVHTLLQQFNRLNHLFHNLLITF